jgi:Helix-turn-helix of DDE superfamily endonuclease
MSLLSEYIEQKPEDTKRLLGIDYQSLQQLIEQAELEKEKFQAKKVRLIARGGGRKTSLSNRDQILLTLTYLRQHPSFQYLGLTFGVSESTANNIFHDWMKILSPLLPPSLLEQFKHEDEYEEFMDDLSEIELIVDSSEQSRQRPTDKEERENSYSGYKHNHTSKNFHNSAKSRRHH